MTETEGPEVGLTETTPVPSGVESTAKARVEQQSWALGLLWGAEGSSRATWRPSWSSVPREGRAKAAAATPLVKTFPQQCWSLIGVQTCVWGGRVFT